MAPLFAVRFVTGISLVNFEEPFVITAMYWSPIFVSGRRPEMSMAMNSKGYVVGNSRSLGCCFLVRRICAYNSHLLTVSFKPFSM